MEYVEELLRKNNISFNNSGQDYLVRCLNPDHDDKNPSMRIDKVDGKFHCFSCGFKGDIFKYFGIIGSPTPIRIAKLKQKLATLSRSQQSLNYPDGYTPIIRDFRGISAETLKLFGAFTCSGELEDRIVFPIRDITGKIVVFVGRHTLSNGNPRYRNYPEGAKLPTFPAKIEQSNSVVLVEGIFDMLNLYDKGLTNVICTFGTNTLMKETKEKLQAYKTQGVQKFYILFDGDDAGREAAKKLEPLIAQMDVYVEILDLEDDMDPGELSYEDVTAIKEYVNAVSNS